MFNFKVLTGTKSNNNLTILNNKLILNQGCKYLASKQVATLNTGSNTWMHIRLDGVGITGKNYQTIVHQ